jgi:beta-lactam-binding protein with PASTA domain
MEQENSNTFKDKMKAWGKFFVSAYFIKNICILVVSIILFFIIVFFSLKAYTRHSQKVSVPSVEGLSINEAIKLIKDRGLDYEISDSVYTSSAKPGTIVPGGQIPPAGYSVKEDRKIFLTYKAWSKEPTKMPRVVKMSLVDAQQQLISCGLLLGKVTKQPGRFNDYVIEARFKGAKISEGKELVKGDVIDLVVSERSEDRLRDDSYDYLDDSNSDSDSDVDALDNGIDNF